MDIVLFNPYFNLKNNYAIVPMGLVYLSTYLKSRGLESKIFELGIHRDQLPIGERYGISNDEIRDILKKERPKIVGISCIFSRHWEEVKEISLLIKKVNKNIKIVIGGNHASCMAEKNKERSIDHIVKGEGEVAFYELCSDLLKGKKPKRIQSQPLIKDLDTLPLPNYSFIKIKKYLEDTKSSPFLMRYPSFGVISSRGCPGKCIFCSVQGVWGRTWRGRSPMHFVDEVEFLNRAYDIREFAFLDDTISLDKNRWIGICEEIIKRELNIKWTLPNGIAHWTLDENILRKMREAGCYRVTFGIESGNSQTRKFIQKAYLLSQAKNIIRTANRLGFWTNSTNIIGFPHETRPQIWDTIEWNISSGVDFAGFYLLCPTPCSEVYKHFPKIEHSAMNEEGVDTDYFTKQELKNIQKKAYQFFIISRILVIFSWWRKIRSFEDLRFIFKMVFTGAGIFWKTFVMKNTLGLLYDD